MGGLCCLGGQGRVEWKEEGGGGWKIGNYPRLTGRSFQLATDGLNKSENGPRVPDYTSNITHNTSYIPQHSIFISMSNQARSIPLQQNGPSPALVCTHCSTTLPCPRICPTCSTNLVLEAARTGEQSKWKKFLTVPAISGTLGLVTTLVSMLVFKKWQKDPRPECGDTLKRVFSYGLEVSFTAEFISFVLTFGTITYCISYTKKMLEHFRTPSTFIVFTTIILLWVGTAILHCLRQDLRNGLLTLSGSD